MHILLLSLWYKPEPVAKPHDFAVELVRRNYDVTVITGFPNYPSGKIYDGYRARWHQLETIDGVRVLRVPHLVDRSHSAVRRVLSYMSFSVMAVLGGLRHVKRPAVIWTYQIGLPGVLLGRLKRVPLIHEVQDLWPDWSRPAGLGLKSILFNLLAAQEKFIYRRARVVTTISPGFKRALQAKGVPEHKLEVIPNWAGEDLVQPADPDEALAIAEGFQGRFNVVYGGNVGAAQGLTTVVQAAAQVRDLPDVQLIIIGDGVERARLQQDAEQLGLTNVRFLGGRPPAQMARYLALADVLLIHLLPDPLYAITIPSKTYGYLASGRPILAAANGDVAELIQATNAGLVCPPGSAVALAQTIRTFRAMSADQRAALGRSGRQAFEDNYTRTQLVSRYEAVVQRITTPADQPARIAAALLSDKSVIIRSARFEDVPSLVNVHLAGFAGFFLTFLGRDFLALLYGQLMADRDGVVLVAEVDGMVVGFVGGILQQTGFYRRLATEHKWAFARAALGAVIRRPMIAPRLLRALRRPAEAQQSAAEACLMSIAVLPDASGHGIGQQLVRAFCSELIDRGAPAVCLTTDRDGNDRTNRFYQQLGFRLSASYVTPEGRPMNEYVAILPL